MEILDLKFAGVPISIWFLGFCFIWFCKYTYTFIRNEISERQERKAKQREYEAMKPLWEKRDREVRKAADELAERVAAEMKRHGQKQD